MTRDPADEPAAVRSARDYYETALGEHYSRMFGEFQAKVGEQRALLERLGVASRLSAGTAVDLGCGSGFQSIALAHRGFRVLAVDFSERLLAELRDRACGLAVEAIARSPAPGGEQACRFRGRRCLGAVDALRQALEIVGCVDVEPRRETGRAQARGSGTAQRHLEHFRGAPGHGVEQLAMRASHADQVVPTIFGGPEDEVGPWTGEAIDGLLKEARG